MTNDRKASVQPPGLPAETTALESRKGGARGLPRVNQRGEPLRLMTVELIRAMRHEFPDPPDLRSSNATKKVMSKIINSFSGCPCPAIIHHVLSAILFNVARSPGGLGMEIVS